MIAVLVVQSWSGLSPRVRGNHLPKSFDNPHNRSIPACAGEPPAGRLSNAVLEVYPRVCGGTDSAIHKPESVGGLSPRVRGNHHMGRWNKHLERSIPACAGEPAALRLAALPLVVYPRVCGGTACWDGRRSRRLGLSPRVRGNRHVLHRNAQPDGSIPACAGEPPLPERVCQEPQVYPRVCGGTLITPTFGRWIKGLSPRVRGNQDKPSKKAPVPGSIPACAGEPRPRRPL